MPPTEGTTASLVWFRRDLRVHDHEPLAEAARPYSVTHLIPAYCWDPACVQPPADGPSRHRIPRLGPYRCRATLEALQSLRAELRGRQSELVIRVGQPAQVLPGLLRNLPASCTAVQLMYHMEPLPEDADLEDAVDAACTAVAAELGMEMHIKRYWGHTLYHPDDLPYQQYQPGSRPKACPGSAPGHRYNRDAQRWSSLPDVMTHFRKITQQHAGVRAVLPAPSTLPPLPAALQRDPGQVHSHPLELYRDMGAVQALQELSALTGIDSATLPEVGAGASIPHTAFPFTVGNAQGLKRLRGYLWGNSDAADGSCADAPPPALAAFADSRMQAVGVDNSTKLSPFLGLGVLSPRQVYHEVVEQGVWQASVGSAVGGPAAGGSGELPPGYNADWLVMHLCIRDFFIFTAMKAGPRLRLAGGHQGAAVEWSRDEDAFERWASGRTGLPFVDACMRELASSGWMSNRGRQNVASLLTKDLHLDWRLGAALFESLLLDHDPAINLANWSYFAGIGTDPRNRRFKTVTQGEKYDADALLAYWWLPELSGYPVRLRHRPWEAGKGGAAGTGSGGGDAAGIGSRRGDGGQQTEAAGEKERGLGVKCGSGINGKQGYPAPMVDVTEHIGVGVDKLKKGSRTAGSMSLRKP